MKKILSLLLLLVMLFSMLPVQTYAASSTEAEILPAVDDAALIKAGAEKIWTGFKWDYKYKKLTYSLGDNGTLAVTDCDPDAKGTITIPGKLGGHKVVLVSSFGDCQNVTKIIVSEGITEIGTLAFSNMPALKEVVLPETVEIIGDYAFSGCTALNKINIPDGVKEIYNNTFANTAISNNRKNYYNSGLYWDGCLLSVAESASGTYKVKSGTKIIATMAFYFCDNIDKIILPDSVTTICSTAIQYGTYDYINIPKNVAYIGNGFASRTFIYKIEVSAENKYFRKANKLLLSKDKKRLVFAEQCQRQVGVSNSVICKIPAGVETIDDYAFSMSNYEQIVLPESVVEIGGNVFFDTLFLKKITIPKSVKKLGRHIFEHSNVQSVIFEGVPEAIPYGTFDNCDKLKSITIPEGVKTIEPYAFKECTQLEKITLPSTLSRIGMTNKYGQAQSPFWGCKNLKTIKVASGSKHFKVVDGILYNKALTKLYLCPTAYAKSTVTLPSTVQVIEPSAFAGCKNLVTVKIPKGVKFLPTLCFENCIKLKSVTIPSTVHYINQGAFFNCPKLDITIPKTVQYIDYRAFGYDAEYKPIKNFKIKGYTGTVAQTYAKENGFTFVSKGKAGADYTTNFSLDMEQIFGLLPCKSYIVDKTENSTHKYVYIYETIYKEDLTELPLYGVSTLIENYTGNGIADGGRVGTGAKLSFTKQTEWEFTEHTFIRMGDANGDGRANKQDLNIAERNIGKTVQDYNAGMRALDADGDKKITKKDVQLLKDFINKKITAKEAFHIYKTYTKKATCSKAGSVTEKCVLCGKVASKTTIPYIKSIKLSEVHYTYNGKTRKPDVTVTDSTGEILAEGTDYTVSYPKSSKLVGVYTVTIKFQGKYSGTKTRTFKINPIKPAVTKLTAGTGRFTVTVDKKSTQVDGYEIQYSTSKAFTNAKTKTVSDISVKTTTVKDLKSNTTYYVRIRTFKTLGDTKCYSGWTTYKSIKTT